MINAVENGANVVASGDYLYHRGEVLSTGVKLLEYAGGKSYHGKAVAIDDCLSVIGSFNMDLRSTYLDTELMLVIRSPEINAELRGYMDALHADCRAGARRRERPHPRRPDHPRMPHLEAGGALSDRRADAAGEEPCVESGRWVEWKSLKGANFNVLHR